MDLKVIYEDKDVLVVDKPAGVVVFPEGQTKENTLIDQLIEKYPKLVEVGPPLRYGVVHRLDKDTSGILLVAKKEEALIFLQKQFSAHTFSATKNSKQGKSWDETSPQRGGKNMQSIFPSRVRERKINFSSSHLLGNREPLEKTLEKRYIALVCGNVKSDSGRIETLIARSPADPRKQKAYDVESSSSYKVKRRAVTEYKVIERFEKYTLLEVTMKTGRKHQIRAHLSHIHHPVAGDTMYGFRDSPQPEGLTRQFLHACYMKIKLPNGSTKEFKSELPEELQSVMKNLEASI